MENEEPLSQEATDTNDVEIPKTKDDVVAILTAGEEPPPFVPGTTIKHLPPFRPAAQEKMEEIHKLCGNITIPVDTNVLLDASFQVMKVTARDEGDHGAEENNSGQEENGEASSALAAVLDHVDWFSHWHDLSVERLQQCLQFWCAWAIKYPNSLPSDKMNRARDQLWKELAKDRKEWSLEKFLGLKDHMGATVYQDGFAHITTRPPSQLPL